MAATARLNRRRVSGRAEGRMSLAAAAVQSRSSSAVVNCEFVWPSTLCIACLSAWYGPYLETFRAAEYVCSSLECLGVGGYRGFDWIRIAATERYRERDIGAFRSLDDQAIPDGKTL